MIGNIILLIVLIISIQREAAFRVFWVGWGVITMTNFKNTTYNWGTQDPYIHGRAANLKPQDF